MSGRGNSHCKGPEAVVSGRFYGEREEGEGRGLRSLVLRTLQSVGS